MLSDVLPVVALVFAFAYAMNLLLLLKHFRKQKEDKLQELVFTSISVIVPFRNEEDHLLKVLNSLRQQDYPKHLLELIFVDDFSEDASYQLLSRELDTSEIQTRLLKVEKGVGKRAALDLGIKAAEGQLIVCTDADCIHHPQWLYSLASKYEREESKMIIGPIAGLGLNTKLEHLQNLEVLGLVGTAAAGVEMGLPILCSGANCAFDKAAFKQVNPFKDLNPKLGDDMALLAAFNKVFPGKISYVNSAKALVKTRLKESLKDYFIQKSRWAKQTKAIPSWYSFLLGFIVAGSILFSFSLFIYSFFHTQFMPLAISVLLLKLIPDYYMVRAVERNLSLSSASSSYFWPHAFWYNLLSFLLIVSSIFLRPKWKGRN